MSKVHVECLDFVNLVRLDAERRLLGDKIFDEKHKDFHDLGDYNDKLKEAKIISFKKGEDTSKSLAAAPIGSRVVFTNNYEFAKGTTWENENTIKIGKDKYSALGFDPKQYYYSETELRNLLAQAAVDEANKKKIEKVPTIKNMEELIYISAIADFD
jgi:hypothetical protein